MPREWVYHEARIGQIVAEAGVRAPAIGDTVEVDGRLDILYERITGPVCSMPLLTSRGACTAWRASSPRWTQRCTPAPALNCHRSARVSAGP